MHYFIALDFEKSAREWFHGYAKSLEKHADKARIVNEHHIHLTLSFLGKLNEKQVETAKAIVNSMEDNSFVLTFNRISRFRPSSSGDIVWVGPEDHSQLSKLHTELEKKLKKSDFDLDERPFTPHVTLARGVKITEEESNRFNTDFEPFKTTVKSMSLLCSKFEEGKLTYETITINEFDES